MNAKITCIHVCEHFLNAAPVEQTMLRQPAGQSGHWPPALSACLQGCPLACRHPSQCLSQTILMYISTDSIPRHNTCFACQNANTENIRATKKNVHTTKGNIHATKGNIYMQQREINMQQSKGKYTCNKGD